MHVVGHLPWLDAGDVFGVFELGGQHDVLVRLARHVDIQHDVADVVGVRLGSH